MDATTANAEQHLINKENEAKSDKINQSKDKGQTVSATAMSLLNIALLKQAMTQPEGFPHYTALMTLIILTLVVQVIVGVLTLFVSHLTKQPSAHSKGTCERILDNVCCCAVRWNNTSGEVEEPDQEPTPSTSKQTKAEDIAARFCNVDQLFDAMHTRDESKSSGLCSCCPWKIVNSTLPETEAGIINAYDDYMAFAVHIEMQQKEAQLTLEFVKEATQNAKVKLEELTGKKDNKTITLEEFEEQAAELQKKIDEVKVKREGLETANKNIKVVSAMGPILRQKADAIVRTEMLEKITFWQNVINYLLYLIFVLNALITGLWMDSTSEAPTPPPASSASSVTLGA